jgi:hypothetical protein
VMGLAVGRRSQRRPAVRRRVAAIDMAHKSAAITRRPRGRFGPVDGSLSRDTGRRLPELLLTRHPRLTR